MASLAIRMATAMVLAGATLTVGAAGDPATACAESREWDVQAFDDCTQGAEDGWLAGDITDAEHSESFKVCCEISGGDWDPTNGPHGGCGAPPAIAADSPAPPPQEAVDPDVPAGTPPIKPGPKPLTPRILGTPTTTPVPVG